MTTYKYTSPENSVVAVIDEDGISRMSGLVAIVPEGATIEPADPPPKEVYSCSAWRIRKLLNALNLRQTVEDIVAQSDNITLKDGWNYATVFASNDPFVISVGYALGKNEDETTELIKQASTL
jgi:hypothetical protein